MVVVKYTVLVAALLVLQVQCQELEELPTFVAGRPEIQRRGRGTTPNTGPTKCDTIETVTEAKTFCGKIDECDEITATVITCKLTGGGVDPDVAPITCSGDKPFCVDDAAGATVCSATKPSSCTPTPTPGPCALPGNANLLYCGNDDECANPSSVITCDTSGILVANTSPCSTSTPFCIGPAGAAACSSVKPSSCSATPTTGPCTSLANADRLFCSTADKCTNDPISVIECNEDGTDISATYTCEGDQPFCVETVLGEAECSDKRSESCPAAPSTFKCTGKGIYPDPLNCKKYYYCTGSGAGKAQTFMCPNLYVFDPSAKNGEVCRLTNNNQCIVVKCTDANANTNVPMVYPNFPKALGAYVVRCKTVPEVFKCDASFEVVLNSYPVKCSIVCKRAENIAHPTINTKYYKCLRSGSKFEPFLTDCYTGMKFDVAKKICVSTP